MRSIRLWLVAVVVAVIVAGGALIAVGVDTIRDGSVVSLTVADPAAALPAALPPAVVPPAPVASAAVPPAGTSSPATTTARRSGATDRATRVRALNAALKRLAGSTPDFSVAVLDRRTGQAYAYRGAVTFDTASIVKTQILACMLLRAQDAGRQPTTAEMSLARPMIRLSDNNATTSLYQRIGGRAALTRCNKRLGLTSTVVNSRWGLTRTTAADQIRLLSSLVDPGSPLRAGSRKTAFTLMSTVDKAQDWGVPSVARAGEITTVKNGWDTRSADGGLWAVNTIGRITSPNGTVDVSLVVLSHNNRSLRNGIILVEKAAELTRRHLGY